MAAVLAKGTTVIRNAASEPHVQDLYRPELPGRRQIEGIGSNTIIIHGVGCSRVSEFTISPDYLEVGSFLGLAQWRAAIRIHGVVRRRMRMINWVFAERLNVNLRMDGDTLIVADEQDLHIKRISAAVREDRRAPWPSSCGPDEHRSDRGDAGEGHRADAREVFESRLYFDKTS